MLRHGNMLSYTWDLAVYKPRYLIQLLIGAKNGVGIDMGVLWGISSLEWNLISNILLSRLRRGKSRKQHAFCRVILSCQMIYHVQL